MCVECVWPGIRPQSLQASRVFPGIRLLPALAGKHKSVKDRQMDREVTPVHKPGAGEAVRYLLNWYQLTLMVSTKL